MFWLQRTKLALFLFLAFHGRLLGNIPYFFQTNLFQSFPLFAIQKHYSSLTNLNAFYTAIHIENSICAPKVILPPLC